MEIVLITAIALHALSGVFWAGTTFALARGRGAGAEQLRRPQLGAALVAILSGAVLGHLTHRGVFGGAERVLAAGAGAAVLAAVIQFLAFRIGSAPAAPQPGHAPARSATAQRIAAGLLAATVLCMVLARYAG